MKTIFSIFFCLLFFACNNVEDKKSEVSASSNEEVPTTTSSKNEADTKNGSLKQNRDYTALFERERGDCTFITAEGIATALNVSASMVETTYSDCNYTLTEANGTKTNFNFSVESWGNKTVVKEIKTAIDNAETFGKNSKLSQYRMSETGDTYLSMHQNRMIRILNEKNSHVIIINYSVSASPTETDAAKKSELKDIARERSYTISNYLLNSQ